MVSSSGGSLRSGLMRLGKTSLHHRGSPGSRSTSTPSSAAAAWIFSKVVICLPFPPSIKTVWDIVVDEGVPLVRRHFHHPLCPDSLKNLLLLVRG